MLITDLMVVLLVPPFRLGQHQWLGLRGKCGCRKCQIQRPGAFCSAATEQAAVTGDPGTEASDQSSIRWCSTTAGTAALEHRPGQRAGHDA